MSSEKNQSKMIFSKIGVHIGQNSRVKKGGESIFLGPKVTQNDTKIRSRT